MRTIEVLMSEKIREEIAEVCEKMELDEIRRMWILET